MDGCVDEEERSKGLEGEFWMYMQMRWEGCRCWCRNR